nr:MAG TPA: hypothetical protein [Caudoviricetes sp.]
MKVAIEQLYRTYVLLSIMIFIYTEWHGGGFATCSKKEKVQI